MSHVTTGQTISQSAVQPDTLVLFDSVRQRSIPIAIYSLQSDSSHKKPLVIFNHGYGANQGGDYLRYSYLNTFLAAKGCVVISVQHELPGDPLLPQTGEIQVVRKPFWERGVANIHFVLEHFRRSRSDLDFSRVCLIGHSNGGDMAALFPVRYPGSVRSVITLDNRRMPLPVLPGLFTGTIRSNDAQADPGVLTPGIEIVRLHHTGHSDMDDSGNSRQHAAIKRAVLRWLQDNDWISHL